VILLAALLLAPAGAAQEEDWYTVELIAFERSGDSGMYAEFWSPTPSLPDISDAIELLDAGELPPVDEAAAPGTPVLPRAFQRLTGEDLELEDVRRRLEASGSYRVLLHIAWRQPGFPEEEAKLAHVRDPNAALGILRPASPQRDDEGPGPFLETEWSQVAPSIALDANKPALDGTVRLHRARYLHLRADLVYYRPASGALGPRRPSDGEPGGRAADTGAASLDADYLPRETAVPTLFRLTQSRRMRSGELHYLDHPLFGLLVQVRPYELPLESVQPEGEASSSSPPAPASPPATGGQQASGG